MREWTLYIVEEEETRAKGEEGLQMAPWKPLYKARKKKERSSRLSARGPLFTSMTN